MDKITVYKETQDNWYPVYRVKGWNNNLNLVCVSFTQTGPNPANGDGQWRVCVWGEDDFGMERDYDDKSACLCMFHKVIGWKYVNQDKLNDHGFITA